MKNLFLTILLFVSAALQNPSFARETINCSGLENPYDEVRRPWCKKPRSAKTLKDIELEKPRMEDTNFAIQSMAIDRYVSTPLQRQTGIKPFAYSPTDQFKRRLWDAKTIPFIITENAEPLRKHIVNALCWWQSSTEIQFYESKTEGEAIIFGGDPFPNKGTCQTTGSILFGSFRGKPRNHISVTSCTEGVFIDEAALPKGPQLDVVETIAHEIGHSLGLQHEHQRPDRDNFIKVNYSSIVDNLPIYGQLGRNMKFPWDELEEPKNASLQEPTPWPFEYDYASIMHYPYNENFEFEVIGHKTFPRLTVGNPLCVSEMDAAAIIFLYSKMPK